MSGLRLKQDFPRGTSNTIFLIEGGPPVPWTKPEEIRFDPALPLPDLFNAFGDMVRVGMGDGSVGHLSRQMSERTLRIAINRQEGEPLGEDWKP